MLTLSRNIFSFYFEFITDLDIKHIKKQAMFTKVLHRPEHAAEITKIETEATSTQFISTNRQHMDINTSQKSATSGGFKYE